MLQLIQPIWLLAMAGIAVPVIIHLWNDRQGKVLAIGSIALLEKRSPRQARTRRLSAWLLLLLRCLGLIFLSLLLAGPVWRRPLSAVTGRGWVLVAEETGDTHANPRKGDGYQSLIDSLLKTGYERHVLAASSVAAHATPAAPPTGGFSVGAPATSYAPASYWDLFAALDRQAPAGLPFYVFSSGLANHFYGNRPVTQRPVHWYTYTPAADSAHSWIEDAWLSSPDSIRIVTGSSGPTGSSYRYGDLSTKAGAAGPVYHIGHPDGRLTVALDSQPGVTVDTAALRILVCSEPKYNNDSRYLAAAIRALQQFTHRNIRLIITGSIPKLLSAGKGSADKQPAGHEQSPGRQSSADWLFWLSAQPVPAGITASRVLVYEPGREMPVDTWIQDHADIFVEKMVAGSDTMIAGSDMMITGGNRITKGGSALTAGGEPEWQVVWKDGFDRPLLTAEAALPGRGRIYHFFSHFDPAWNGLVWSPYFPVLLQELLGTGHHDPLPAGGLTGGPGDESGGGRAERHFVDPGKDRRILDPAQICPQTAAAGMSGAPVSGGAPLSGTSDQPGASRVRDLAPVCWILLLLLFLAERMISFSTNKTRSDV